MTVLPVVVPHYTNSVVGNIMAWGCLFLIVMEKIIKLRSNAILEMDLLPSTLDQNHEDDVKIKPEQCWRLVNT